jgi:hypothetical protein
MRVQAEGKNPSIAPKCRRCQTVRRINSDSCLLTPFSCPQKMKVTPEICMKTKEREKRFQVSGVREKVRSPGSEVWGTLCHRRRSHSVS